MFWSAFKPGYCKAHWHTLGASLSTHVPRCLIGYHWHLRLLASHEVGSLWGSQPRECVADSCTVAWDPAEFCFNFQRDFKLSMHVFLITLGLTGIILSIISTTIIWSQMCCKAKEVVMEKKVNVIDYSWFQGENSFLKEQNFVHSGIFNQACYLIFPLCLHCSWLLTDGKR